MNTSAYTFSKLDLDMVRKFVFFILRVSQCKYNILGCEWKGKWGLAQEHEVDCEFVTKSPDEIIACVQNKRPTDSEGSLIKFVCKNGTKVMGE